MLTKQRRIKNEIKIKNFHHIRRPKWAPRTSRENKQTVTVKQDSPIPRTRAPNAPAATDRTSGTASRRQVFKGGRMVPTYGWSSCEVQG